MTDFNNLNIDKSDWELTRLGDLADEISKREDNPSTSKFDRFVGLEHFVSGDLKIKNWKPTDDLVSAAKVFQSGDILFARRNAYLERASMVEFDGVCSGDAFVLRENNELVVPGFLSFVVNSNALWSYANSNAAGTMSKRVKWRDLAEYQFLLPPKDQQAKIAELLWAMDDVVEKEKEVLQLSEKIFLSFSKRIFTESEGEVRSLKELGSIIMGQSPPGKTYNESGDGFAFLQGNAEFGERYPNNIKFTTAPKKIAPKDSILISVRAPVGDLNIADKEYCIGRGLAAIVVNDSNLREYVFNFLTFAEYELTKHSGGSTFKAINKDKLSSLKLITPKNENIEQSVDGFRILSKAIEDSKNQIHISYQLQKSLINEIFSV